MEMVSITLESDSVADDFHRCFWINLYVMHYKTSHNPTHGISHRPTGGVALALLVTNLHFNPLQHGKTFKEHVAEFDFLGLMLLVGGTVCLLLGFNQSEFGCKYSE